MMNARVRPQASRTQSEFGSLLRHHRLECGLSQLELAERARLSVEAISALERGFRKRPQTGTINLLGAALGLNPVAFQQLRSAARMPAPGDEPDPSSPGEHLGAATNLPARATSFIGRDREVDEIIERVGTSRLVTLVGTGGIGKTRTSIEAGERLRNRFADGVWFVEFAPLTRTGYVASTIARAVDRTVISLEAPIDSLVRLLARRECLLILDNCEHLTAEIAEVAAAVIRRCPLVRVLATSRQSLGIDGENLYRLSALALPQRGSGNRRWTAEEAGSSPAVALLAERARAANAYVIIDDANAGTLAEVCRRLDGIPLAIELAAPRLRMFSPEQLLARFDDRFRLLAGSRRDAMPRQQTLRALIGWSYDLLDEAERKTFRALGLFAGSFTLEAAVALTASPLDEFGAIDVIDSLVDKSLVIAEEDDGGRRFRLYESTRAFALEKVEEAGEYAVLATRHLAYVRDLFETSVGKRERTGSGRLHEKLFATELDDVRLAADYALAAGEIESGAELLAAVNGISWARIGQGVEGLARLQAFRDALCERRPALVAKLCAWIAVLARELGRRTLAGISSTAAVERARRCDDINVLATALARHANVMVALGRIDEARAALDEASAFPDPSAMQERRILEARANLLQLCGDLDGAVATWNTVRKRLEATGDTAEARVAALALSECEFERGDVARAAAIIEAFIDEARLSSDWGLLARALCDLATYRLAGGALDAARVLATEALDVVDAHDRESPYFLQAMDVLALRHFRNGDRGEALRVLERTAASRSAESRQDAVPAWVRRMLDAALENAPAAYGSYWGLCGLRDDRDRDDIFA